MSDAKIKFYGLTTVLLAAVFALSACSSLRPDFVKTA